MLEVSYQALLAAIADTIKEMNTRPDPSPRVTNSFLRTFAKHAQLRRKDLRNETAAGSEDRALADFDILTQVVKDLLQ